MPHQVCQFHVLHDVIQPTYEAVRSVTKATRKQLQRKLKAVRKQLKRRQSQATTPQTEQLGVLDDYTLGEMSVLNRDGFAPFDFAAVHADAELDDVAASLEGLNQKGEP